MPEEAPVELRSYQVLAMWGLTIPAGLIVGYLFIHIFLLNDYAPVRLEPFGIDLEGSLLLILVPLGIGFLYGVIVGERIEIPMLIALTMGILGVTAFVVALGYFSPVILGSAVGTDAYGFRTLGIISIQWMISSMPLLLGTLAGGIIVSD